MAVTLNVGISVVLRTPAKVTLAARSGTDDGGGEACAHKLWRRAKARLAKLFNFFKFMKQ